MANNNSVFRIGIKKSEISYIKKRLKDLGLENRWGLLEEFTDYIDKQDDEGLRDWMSDKYSKDYERIRDEILSKRNKNLCPFCSEVVKDLNKHLRQYHKEEIVRVYGVLTKQNLDTARKEIILENL
jgi:hypothetical protein